MTRRDQDDPIRRWIAEMIADQHAERSRRRKFAQPVMINNEPTRRSRCPLVVENRLARPAAKSNGDPILRPPVSLPLQRQLRLRLPPPPQPLHECLPRRPEVFA